MHSTRHRVAQLQAERAHTVASLTSRQASTQSDAIAADDLDDIRSSLDSIRGQVNRKQFKRHLNKSLPETRFSSGALGNKCKLCACL
jgi:hypothetical protein